MKLRELIRLITSHPCTTLVTALIPVAIGIAEAWETIECDIAEANVGVHHGVLIFGLVSLIGVVPDVLAGLECLIAHHWEED